MLGKDAMINGTVTANREAVITLDVIGSNQKREKVEAVIDTGFNGYLTLPSDLSRILELPLAGNRRATLGDGNVVVLDVCIAKTLWHGQEREILVLQSGSVPLVGMSLLYGNRLIVDVLEDGDVAIELLQ
ncbi:MAG: clan AA aspartic protease [Gemmatimonadetes bacterium]|nr:clan AA aspartic protease [Gemmatimonadota bacterium]